MVWIPYIKGFEAYLLMEKSLSKNSIEAYLRDVEKLVEYFGVKGIDLMPEKVKGRQIEEFFILPL
ncbi:MAG: site-specific integrase [Saprospiraceae bacterium]|nr:site-specific integrase [Saprospiraceae bacterium]